MVAHHVGRRTGNEAHHELEALVVRGQDDLVEHVLDPDSAGRPGKPYTAAAKEWEELERFVESRLRPE